MESRGVTQAKFPMEYIVCDLIRQGALLVAVDDEKLIMLGHRLKAKISACDNSRDADKLIRDFAQLNRERDAEIVRAVYKDLIPPVNGMLFLGGAHNVKERFARRGIQTVVPQEVFRYMSCENYRNDPYLAQYMFSHQ